MKFRPDREWPGLIALAVLYIFLALAAPRFFEAANLRDLALSNVSVLLVAMGMTLVIVVAQIDISVGSLFAVVSIVCGLAAKAGIPVGPLAVIAVGAGAVLGAVNGGLVSYVKAPSIVATLATMVAWREALRWSTGGAWVEGLPSGFQWFGLGQLAGEIAIVGSTLILFAALWWASRNVAALRAVYATGSDSEAARLAGISVTKVVFWVFVLTGALTGLAALVNAVRFSDVPANSGNNLELKAIAAVVVGGTPITGGRGSLPGTLIGVALLGSIGPALTFLGINPYWEKAIQGGIILVTVLFDALRRPIANRQQVANLPHK
ncbi:MAG TPA: ABC transporter permease [Bryobacteraceae bacterium]|nr:ABC transporter permease [Bryobacteraceae bacterium]